MGKRKRGSDEGRNSSDHADNAPNGKYQENSGAGKEDEKGNDGNTTVQIVVGTYEKVLHGITATISTKTEPVEFADSFLFAAHSSAIRCLALSPQSSQRDSSKLLLASGGSDQDVNVYQLSRAMPRLANSKNSALPSLNGTKVKSNPDNRELGSLQHHGGGVNALGFPTRSKLMSAGEDCTIAVTRTRDWTMLSTIKAPIPKAHGRPSGDTAPSGGTPAGINDFAIHPSKKLMVSVGKGEKCMRLWNLVTGKKAGVLNFEKNVLQQVSPSKWASGEGQKVRWNYVGEEYVVAFESGCAVYGLVRVAFQCPPRVLLTRGLGLQSQRYFDTSSPEQDPSTTIFDDRWQRRQSARVSSCFYGGWPSFIFSDFQH